MDPYRINEKKVIVNFRLSDETRDEMNEIVQIRRVLDELNGEPWRAERRNRTEMLELAITAYLQQLRATMKQREESIAKAKADGQELLNKSQRSRKRPAKANR